MKSHEAHAIEFANVDLETLELCEGCGAPLTDGETETCSHCEVDDNEPIQLQLL